MKGYTTIKEDTLVKVGEYNLNYNKILGLEIKKLEIYCSKGLSAHMIKRRHFKCLKYIDDIPDIIANPDYIGVNPNERETSIEFIKKYNDNILVGIKLDTNKDYLYVSTMHDVQESKIKRRLYSGRLKEVFIDNGSED